MASKISRHIWYSMMKEHHGFNSDGKSNVVDEWRDYLAFEKWYDAYPSNGDNYLLNTTILGYGSLMHSPDTCCLVPPEIDLLAYDLKDSPEAYAADVVFEDNRGKYRVYVRVGGRRVRLGSFDTRAAARREWQRDRKRRMEIVLANNKNKIALDVYHALASMIERIVDS